MLGGTELFVILCGIVVLFGADQASSLARSAGETIGTAKQHKKELDEEVKNVESELEEATTVDVEHSRSEQC
jgi:TatA/E family protein of Tat protein translocase